MCVAHTTTITLLHTQQLSPCYTLTGAEAVQFPTNPYY